MQKMSVNESSAYIRNALKKKFPNQKFSVTKEEYSGGSTVIVRWTDGMAKKPVVDFAEGFHGTTFNSMDDSSRVLDNEFGNSYIDFSRNISDVYMKMTAARIANEHGLDIEINDDTMQIYFNELGNNTLGMMARMELLNKDLPTISGNKPKKIEKQRKLYPRHNIVPIVKTIGKKGSVRYWTFFNCTKRPIAKDDVEIIDKEGRAQFIKL